MTTKLILVNGTWTFTAQNGELHSSKSVDDITQVMQSDGLNLAETLALIMDATDDLVERLGGVAEYSPFGYTAE